jgi:hypothetical protein
MGKTSKFRTTRTKNRKPQFGEPPGKPKVLQMDKNWRGVAFGTQCEPGLRKPTVKGRNLERALRNMKRSDERAMR